MNDILTDDVYLSNIKVSKDAKIRYRYNQVPHLTQDTNGKVTNFQLDTTNESQEVSPFPEGDQKAFDIGLKLKYLKKYAGPGGLVTWCLYNFTSNVVVTDYVFYILSTNACTL